jgi:GH3 auxin-responsive promoter
MWMLLDRLINLVANYKKKTSHARLNQYKNDPKSIQMAILKQILKANQQTVFGREHHFAHIDSHEDFKRNVPVKTSGQYATWLTRVYQGERNVITRENPYYFAMTTGSTGDYKYIPITRRFRQETDNSTLVFIRLLEQHFPEMTRCSIQFLVGSGDGGSSPDGVPKGFVSGFNYKHLPKAITRRFVIPYWVFTLEDAHDRYYAMARYMLDADDLVAIGAISPLNITNVAKSILENVERLISDLANQTLTLSAANQPQAEKQTFSARPQKLAALKAWQSAQGGIEAVQLMNGLFDKLKTLVTWSGGNMSYALTELEQYFGPKQLFEMPFSASEGIFSIPYAPNTKGGIAAITGHFLEFIPEDQIDQDLPDVLPVWEVEQGKTYYQVITTSGGLYRYNMEDLVVVNGFWGKVPILEFLSKKARQVSISNERMTEKDFTDATNRVCSRMGVRFDHFIFFPCRSGFYRMVVDHELPEMIPFLQAIETELRKTSMGYDFEREDLLLQPIKMNLVDKAALAQYVQGFQFKSKLPSGQFKPLHLSNVFEGHTVFETIREYTMEGLSNE